MRCLVLLILPWVLACGAPEESLTTSPSSLSSYLHPAFPIDETLLREMVASLPLENRQYILDRPQSFLEQLYQALRDSQELLVLVNKEHGLGPEFMPEDLTFLRDYPALTLSRQDHRLREPVIPPLLEMVAKAAEEGITLPISSTYRSYEYQERLFQRYVKQDGLKQAETYSARPGKSQHQLGTVIDFGSIDDSFAQTKAGKWVLANAGTYGFSLSYPRGMEDYTGYIWESWHYRYIGKKAAQLEAEYFGGIQERMLRFLYQYLDILAEATLQ